MRNIIKNLGVLVIGLSLVTPIFARTSENVYWIEDFQQTQEAYNQVNKVIDEVHKKENIEYLFLEVGYVEGKRITHYINTGDEQLLDNIMQNMYPENRTEEFKELLQVLYQLNKSSQQKMQIVGIGKDNKENTLRALEELLTPYTSEYEDIKKDLEEIKRIPSLDVFEILKKKVDAAESIYGEVLSDEEWIDLTMILNSILAHREEHSLLNLDIAYNIYKDETIVYIGNRTIENKIENPYTITFDYQNSSVLNWQTMDTQSYRDDNQNENADNSIIIKDSSAATAYGVNVDAASRYVAQNAVSIDVQDKKFTGLQALQPVLKDNKLFLAGEIHGNIGSIEMQLYMIKYFHEQAGVNKILFEYNYGIGKMMNDYIQNGDSQLLKAIMEELKGSFIYTQEFEYMLKELYTYNQAQSQDKKLEIIGIDIIRGEKGIPYIWNQIFEDANVPNIAQIEKNKDTYFSFVQYYQAIKDEINKNYNYYQQELGNQKLFDLEMILLSLTKDFAKYDNIMLERERTIIDMFEKLAITYPKDKFFAQMGEYHASQKYSMIQSYGYSCGEYLSKYSEAYKGKVISIMYAYENSFFIGAGESYPIGKDYADILYAPKKSNYYLIDATGQDNPLAQVYLNSQENYVADSLQYIINIYDKPAMNAYKK